MTNQKAAEMIRNDMKLHHDYLSGEYRKALKMAISALQTQDSKTRSCDTCKHNPVSKKWPCVDCDMREPADRWEPQEVKNSTQEAKNLTQKKLDTISRTAAISELMEWVEKEEKKSWSTFKGLFHWTGIKAMLECLPSVEPEIAENLYLCKCYITDKDGFQHEVIHTGDIRRVTGWEI